MSSHIDDLILEAKSKGYTNLYLNYQHLRELPETLKLLTKAERIYLKYNILTKLPADIWKLESLVELYLHSNNLQGLPAEIGSLKCLESLDVSHNNLKCLPPSVGQLCNLKHLHLANNHLSLLPKEIGNLLQLRVLDVMNNCLSWLPWQMCHCINLETLSFDGNEVKWLPWQLTSLTHLKELSGSRNKLQSLPQDMDQLISLESLLIDSNCSLCALPATILRIPNLQILGINRCNLDESCNTVTGGYFPGINFLGSQNDTVLPLLELATRATYQGRGTQSSQQFGLPRNLDKILHSPLGHCYNCRQPFFTGLFLHYVDCKTALRLAGLPDNRKDFYQNIELGFVFASCCHNCNAKLQGFF